MVRPSVTVERRYTAVIIRYAMTEILKTILTPTAIQIFVHVTAEAANMVPFFLSGTSHTNVPGLECKPKALSLRWSIVV
jgi:hypothetical protein